MIVSNRSEDGRDNSVPVVEHRVEEEVVFPLLRGRDVHKWSASPGCAVILPHSADNPVSPIPFHKLGKGTQGFLGSFKEKLQSRKKFRNFDPSGKEWHGLYSVLSATFSPYKVVWKEMAKGSICSVISTYQLANVSDKKVIIPDHKLMLIPCENLKEAHYIAAILNSSLSRYIVCSFAISTGISTHILEKLPIQRYKASIPLHNILAQLSQNCHIATAKGDMETVAALETNIDQVVAKLWGITDYELKSIQDALKEIEKPKRKSNRRSR